MKTHDVIVTYTESAPSFDLVAGLAVSGVVFLLLAIVVALYIVMPYNHPGHRYTQVGWSALAVSLTFFLTAIWVAVAKSV